MGRRGDQPLAQGADDEEIIRQCGAGGIEVAGFVSLGNAKNLNRRICRVLGTSRNQWPQKAPKAQET
jgi:hypothetical protein